MTIAADTPSLGSTTKIVVLDLDDRGRVSIGKLFGPNVERVIATTDPQGRVLLEPAVVMPALMPRIRQNPELMAQMNATLDQTDPNQKFRKYVPRADRAKNGKRTVSIPR